ncbi:MAG TPA: Gfo/Idh/MocA family oxidoreductase [Chthonomonadaceae bacterium]|nr:Gfo/Idh/MocA family oxidoreductase [Chthonomonadaceae bacterium]
MDTVRWGILGLGRIANDFAIGLQAVPGAQLVAVGSRSKEKAQEFGERYAVPGRYAGYEELAADPNVDIVYVATPHPMHADDAMLCLSAGKAVLCEKPFTLNAAQAEKVIAMARQKKRFLMEGMWTRFYPIMAKIRDLLDDGTIGEPRMVQADFGFRVGWDIESRILNLKLGGGALLDVGVYCISLASMIFGTPSHVTGEAHIGETGVDEQAALTLRYPKGQLATLFVAVRTNTPQAAYIGGTEGCIQIHSPWWCPTAMCVARGSQRENVALPRESNGFNYEIAEVMRCLREGKLESDIMPLDETLSIMRTMDTLRTQCGLKYPME